MRAVTAVVQKLKGSESAEVVRHLRELSAVDRVLRFGAAANDAAIERYVGSIDFGRDALFGVFEPEATLVGLAHLALRRDNSGAELGVSVAPHRRGGGYGYALLSVAAAHAGKLGLRKLYLHSLDDRVMVHLARKAGMTVVRKNTEVDAHLALPPAGEFRAAQRGYAMLAWLASMRSGRQRPRQA